MYIDRELFNLAESLSRRAHRDQKDKNGVTYIHHPLRVRDNVSNGYKRIVALLHDVLEDTDITYETLEALFPTIVLDAIDALTHKEGEMYVDYIARISKNEIAIEVKIADILDNMKPERWKQLSYKTRNRLSPKYTNALSILLPLLGETS